MKRVLVIGEYHPELKAALDEAVKNNIIKSYINLTSYNQQADKIFKETGLPQAFYEDELDFALSFVARSDIATDWIIMKGHIHSDNFLRIVLKLNNALCTRFATPVKWLSHCAIMERGTTQFILTDAAFNLALKTPSSNNILCAIRNNALECYDDLIENISGIKSLEGPSVVYALAENNEKIPNYSNIEELNYQYNYCKPIKVLQLDAALDLDIAKLKNPNATNKDLAKIVIVPDINVGNAIWKSLTVFGDFVVAGIVWGTAIPCLLNSRGDKKASYYRSLEYGVKILPFLNDN